MNDGFINFKKQAVDINKHYPKLTFTDGEDGMPYISGELELKDERCVLIDIYFIRILPTFDYPLRFPHVFETNERIPINIDWHVFHDGRCCIKAIPEEISICRQGITLIQFIGHQLIPYFFNQKHRELHGFFLHERSHNIEGNIEFFKDVFKTDNFDLIAKGLLFIKERNEPNQVQKCFCGNGSKYRNCHKAAYKLLSIFSNEELDVYLKLISTLLCIRLPTYSSSKPDELPPVD